MIRNRNCDLVRVITQPWRQLGAILWFHVTINIFITIHYKLIKFNTHKLQVMGQHTDHSACASWRARQNFKLLKITFWTIFSTNQVILSISKFPVRKCPRARTKGRNSIIFFHMIWIPDTIIDNFYSYFQSLLTFHKAVRARQSWKSARAAMGNIM